MRRIAAALAALFAVSLSWAQPAPDAADGPDAAKVAQVESVHLSLATAYEVRARELEALVEEHERMKRDGVDKFYVNDKASPMGELGQLESHHDAIAESARRLRETILEAANWHRMRAAALRGR